LTANHGVQVLAKTREEHHETPSLLNQVSDQIEMMKQDIHCANPRVGVAKLHGVREAFLFVTADVEEKWRPEDKFGVIEDAKKLTASFHDYLGAPQVGQEDQDRRLDEYLADEPPGRGLIDNEPIATATSKADTQP